MESTIQDSDAVEDKLGEGLRSEKECRAECNSLRGKYSYDSVELTFSCLTDKITTKNECVQFVEACNGFDAKFEWSSDTKCHNKCSGFYDVL